MEKLSKYPPERQTKISFDPGPHKYYDDQGIVYTSVTTLIGAYKKPFNKKYWLMYKALQKAGFEVRHDRHRGKQITVNGIVRDIDELYNNPINAFRASLTNNEWKRLTDIACARGNEIHDNLENTINQSKNDPTGKTNRQVKPMHSLSGEVLVMRTQHDLESTGIQYRYPLIYFRLSKYISMGCTLYAEKRIFSTAFQIAGMIDVLIVKGKHFAILDWKTNKDVMVFESGYFKKVKMPDGSYQKTSQFVPTNNKLLAPIDHLPEAKGMIYSMQLSMYALLMIRWGYKLVKNGLEICHLRPNEKPKFIPITPYLEECADLLIDHYHKRVVTNSKSVTHFGIN